MLVVELYLHLNKWDNVESQLEIELSENNFSDSTIHKIEYSKEYVKEEINARK